jgi:hypothetical protein
MQMKIVVDTPEDYNYQLMSGVWHKVFSINDVDPVRLDFILGQIKTVLYIIEKDDHSEISDMLLLLSRTLITDTYNLYDETHDDELREIESMGYDLVDLENKLLLIRMFDESIKTLVREKDFIKYKVGELSNPSIKLLFDNEQINLNYIVVGKYIDLYLSQFSGDERILIEHKIRSYLDVSLGVYLDTLYYFNSLLVDMAKSTLFSESVSAQTVWLDENFPETKLKIETKYLIV